MLPIKSSFVTCLVLVNSFAVFRQTSFAFAPLPKTRTTSSELKNVLSDLGDLLSGGKLVPQASLPYGEPLSPVNLDEHRTFAVQERPISFTGEDFDVHDANTGKRYCRVRGALLHLPGKDKMRLIDDASGSPRVILDRKMVALKPTYDIYRSEGGEKIGWIEKALVSMTDTFDLYLEKEKGGIGPFAAPPAYKLEGDFLERRFVMKNKSGQVVAKITKDWIVEFDSFDHYQVQVAPGMDSALVLACTCAIDEEFDEEHKKRKQGS